MLPVALAPAPNTKTLFSSVSSLSDKLTLVALVALVALSAKPTNDPVNDPVNSVVPAVPKELPGFSTTLPGFAIDDEILLFVTVIPKPADNNEDASSNVNAPLAPTLTVCPATGYQMYFLITLRLLLYQIL